MAEVLEDKRKIFWNAARLALRDGELSNGEKRILVKLAHTLKLSDEEPKLVFESIVKGKDPGEGSRIDGHEMRLVYGQVLEAMLIHTDRSDDVLSMIVFLRKLLRIDESEHRAITRSLDRQLEEIVHRSFIEEFRMRLKDSADRIGDIVENLNILPGKSRNNE